VSTDKRHVYWIRPGLLRRQYDGRIIAVTFGIGRVWVGGTHTHGWCIDLYWPRERRIG
jgi:hypothetical protein